MNVLMYHSISNTPGPTSIPPEVFRAQIEILEECGYQGITLPTFKTWHEGDAKISRSVVITFDDGFADFAEHAFPVLQAHHYPATVFLPSGRLGGLEDWEGAPAAPRQLMTWSQVRELSQESIDFGGHSVKHMDLTTLAPQELQHEVRQCREEIADRIGRTPLAFAPPYGRTGRREREEIRKWFQVSVGTRLARADHQCDLYDVPRIEMHYFRNLLRWRRFLEGRAEWYFESRRVIRRLKEKTAALLGTTPL